MYHETIPTAQLVYRVALVMQEYTQSGGVSIVMRVISTWHKKLQTCVHFCITTYLSSSGEAIWSLSTDLWMG